MIKKLIKLAKSLHTKDELRNAELRNIETILYIGSKSKPKDKQRIAKETEARLLELKKNPKSRGKHEEYPLTNNYDK